MGVKTLNFILLFTKPQAEIPRTYMIHKIQNPQSAYAQHILNNRHDYGPIQKTMSLLKHVNNNSLSSPYDQLFIQT